MKTLYMVKYGCGQWEDYHEDIECMFETFDEAKQKCLQLQSEVDQRLQDNQHWYDTLNKLDEEDIDIVDGQLYCSVYRPKGIVEIHRILGLDSQLTKNVRPVGF